MIDSIVTVWVTFEKAPRIVVLTMGTESFPGRTSVKWNWHRGLPPDRDPERR